MDPRPVGAGMEQSSSAKDGDSEQALTTSSLGALLAAMLALSLAGPLSSDAAAIRTVVIGDSLSAEYDALPGIPGVEDPTAYAAITVPGWESRCWVEVLAELRPGMIDFGGKNNVLPGWNDLRFTGYEYNFAIPGFTAAQYQDIVVSSLFYNQQYLTYKLTLAATLQQRADACVVWIGANDFRANYGFLCDGGDPTALIQSLQSDVAQILDFVRNQAPSVHIIVVNLPDLGATPTKQASCPDPAKRQHATDATILANQLIAQLAAARNVPVVDIFAATTRLIQGQAIWYGPVDIRPTSDPDNNPRYAFTRDGLHPNTGLQTEIARQLITALNQACGTSVPQITDSEALTLLGINPQQPYLDWTATRLSPETSGFGADPDSDGLVNLIEFLFDLDPQTRSASPVTISTPLSGPEAYYHPVQDRTRLASVIPQWSTNLLTWEDVPGDRLQTASDGRVTVKFLPSTRACFLRLKAAIRPVQ